MQKNIADTILGLSSIKCCSTATKKLFNVILVIILNQYNVWLIVVDFWRFIWWSAALQCEKKLVIHRIVISDTKIARKVY